MSTDNIIGPYISETRTTAPRGFRFGTVRTTPGRTYRYVIRNRDGRAATCPLTPATDELLPERELCRALHAACDADPTA